MNTRHRFPLLAVVAALLWLAAISPAHADTPASGGDVQIAQTLGDRDLTVVLRRITAVPGPLRMDVITHAGTAPGTLTVAVSPTASGLPTAHGTVVLGGHARQLRHHAGRRQCRTVGTRARRRHSGPHEFRSSSRNRPRHRRTTRCTADFSARACC